jgi:hypothetical protein
VSPKVLERTIDSFSGHDLRSSQACLRIHSLA